MKKMSKTDERWYWRIVFVTFAFILAASAFAEAGVIAEINPFAYTNNGTVLSLNNARFNITLDGSASNISIISSLNNSDPSNVTLHFDVDFDYNPLINSSSSGFFGSVIDYILQFFGLPPSNATIKYTQNVSLKIDCASTPIRDDENKTIYCEGYSLNYQDIGATGWTTYPTELEGKKVSAPITNKSWDVTSIGKHFKLDPTIGSAAGTNYDGASGANHRRSVKDANGILHDVFQISAYNACTLIHASSSDNGDTWANHTIMANAGSCQMPGLTLQTNNYLLLSYYNASSDTIDTLNSSNAGVTWGGYKVTTLTTNSPSGHIFANGTSGVLFGCEQNGATGFRCASSTDGGNSWGAIIVVYTSSGYVGWDGMFGTDGLFHFVFWNATASNYVYGNTNDLGANFKFSAPIYGFQYATTLAITNDRILELYGITSTLPRVVNYTNSSTNFLTSITIANITQNPPFTNPNSYTSISVAISATNDRHIWIANATTLQYLNSTDGKIFSSPINLGAINPGGTVWIASHWATYAYASNASNITSWAGISYQNQTNTVEFQRKLINQPSVPVFTVTNNTPQNTTYVTLTVPYNISFSSSDSESAQCQYSLNDVLGSSFSMASGATNQTTLTGQVGSNTINTTCTNATTLATGTTGVLSFMVSPTMSVTSTLPANATYQVYNNIPYSFYYVSAAYSGAFCGYTLNSAFTNLSYIVNNTVNSGLIAAITNSQGNNIYFTCTNATISSNSAITYFETRYTITPTQTTPTNTTYRTLIFPYRLDTTSASFNSIQCQYSLNGVLGSSFSMANNTDNQTSLTGTIGSNYLNSSCSNGTTVGSISAVYFDLHPRITVANTTPQNTTYFSTTVPYYYAGTSEEYLSFNCSYYLDGIQTNLGQEYNNTAFSGNLLGLTNGGHNIYSACTNNTVAGVSNTTYFNVNVGMNLTQSAPTNSTYTYLKIPYTLYVQTVGYASATCQYSLNGVLGSQFSVGGLGGGNSIPNSTTLTGTFGANTINSTCVNGTTEVSTPITYFEIDPTLALTSSAPTNSTYLNVNVPYSSAFVSSEFGTAYCGYTLDSVFTNLSYQTNNTAITGTLSGLSIGGHRVNFTCANTTYTNTTSTVYFEVEIDGSTVQNTPTNTTYHPYYLTVPYSFTFNNVYGIQSAQCQYSLNGVLGTSFSMAGNSTNTTSLTGTLGANTVNTTCTNNTVGFTNTTGLISFELEADFTVVNNTPQNTTYRTTYFDYSISLNSAYAIQSAVCQYSLNGVLGTQFGVAANSTNTTRLTGTIGSNFINTSCSNSSVGFTNSTSVLYFDLHPRIVVANTTPQNTTYTTLTVPYQYTFTSEEYGTATCSYVLDGANTNIGIQTNNTAYSGSFSGLTIGGHNIYSACTSGTITGVSNTTYFDYHPIMTVTNNTPQNTTYLSTKFDYSVSMTSSFGSSNCQYSLNGVLGSVFNMANGGTNTTRLTGVIGDNTINTTCTNSTLTGSTALLHFNLAPRIVVANTTPQNITYLYTSVLPYQYTFVSEEYPSAYCGYYLDAVFTNLSIQYNNTAISGTIAPTVGGHNIYVVCVNTTITGTSNTTYFETEADLTVSHTSPTNSTYRYSNILYDLSLSNTYGVSSATCQRSLNGVLSSQYSVAGNSSYQTQIVATIGDNILNSTCVNSTAPITNSTGLLHFEFAPRILVSGTAPTNSTYYTFAVPYSYSFTSEEYPSAYCGYTLDTVFTNLSIQYNNTAFNGVLPITTNGDHIIYMTCTNVSITGTSSTIHFNTNVNISASISSPLNATYLQDWAYLTFTAISNYFTSFTCNRTIDYTPTSIVVNNNTQVSFNYIGLNNLNAGNHTISVSCGNGTVLSNQPIVTFLLTNNNITALSYNPIVYETDLVPHSTSISVADNVNNVKAWLNWDGTDHAATSTPTGNVYAINASVHPPLETTNNTARNFYWTYEIDFANGTQVNITNTTQSQNVIFGYFPIASDFPLFVVEQAKYPVNITLFNNPDLANLSAYITFNGTNWSMIEISTTQFQGKVTIPILSSALMNFTTNATLNVTYNGISKLRMTSNVDIVASMFNMVQCSNTSNAINFTMVDELTNASVNFSTFNAVVSLYGPSPSYSRSLTFSVFNVSSVSFCTTPENLSTSSAWTITYGGEGYPARSFSQTYSNLYSGTSATNSSRHNQTLGAVNGIYYLLIVVDQKSNPVQNAYIEAYRNSALVQSAYTNPDGTASFLFQPLFPYLIVVSKTGYYPNTFNYTVPYASTSMVIQISSIAPSVGQEKSDYYVYSPTLEFSCVNQSVSGNQTIICDLYDPTKTLQNATLYVEKVNFTDYEVVCANTVNGTNGTFQTLTCDLGPNPTGTYTYMLSVSGSPTTTLLKNILDYFRTITQFAWRYNQDGLFLGMLITIGIGFIGFSVWPPLSVVFGTVGLFMSAAMGFVEIPMSMMVLLALIVGIIFYKIKG